MGLVQAEPDKRNAVNSIKLDGFHVIWDDQVDQMSKMYGKLVVDYLKSMFGGKIYVGFGGVYC